MEPEKTTTKLNFLFNENGFAVNDRGEELPSELAEWQERFEADKWEALYDFGFAPRPRETNPAGLYLYTVADMFLSGLTVLPSLEVLREDARVQPSESRDPEPSGQRPPLHWDPTILRVNGWRVHS